KLVYKGNVQLKNGRNAALVTVSGQMLNLGEGEKVDKITLLKIYEDSIHITFDGHPKTYLKATN
ncbi:MAG: hypothetical protein AAF985_08495, partial [Bacteroidota bacterium]